MLTVPGIGETSALQILGELVVLSDTADARQWVAFSGLDPCIFTSGSSVEKRPRISRGGSRHLRRALSYAGTGSPTSRAPSAPFL